MNRFEIGTSATIASEAPLCPEALPDAVGSSPFRVGVMCFCSGLVFPAFAVELRMDGMTLTTRHQLPEGQSLILRFPLPGAGRLELAALCGEQTPCANTHTYLTDLRFAGMSQRQRDSLSLWLVAHQRDVQEV